ncbi:MAG: GntR family transcriptional regulator [Geodermatophilaceae bacterium]
MTSSELTGASGGLPALPRRSSTAEHAAAMLRLEIAQGRLLPGTKLREEHVSAAFAISRNTVREAFRLLSHERLVDHTLHRGVYVRTVTADDIRAMYRTRRLVEPLGVEAAIGDAAAIAELSDLVEAAESAAARDDWQVVGTRDIDFHRRLMASCDSGHVSTMVEQLLAELRLAFLRMPDRRALHGPYVARNRRLVTLLEAGDRSGALSELRDYLYTAEGQLLGSLDQRPRGDPMIDNRLQGGDDGPGAAA